MKSARDIVPQTETHTFKLIEFTLKTPITTAADDKFCDNFLNFRKKKIEYFMRIVCQQTILLKYHALFVNFEKSATFETVVCYKLVVALYGLI